jgi:hypothetical protein
VIRELASLLLEAEQLHARKDGCHDMRGAVAVVRGYVSLIGAGEKLEAEPVRRLLRDMRVCAATGFFPKRHWADA